MNNKKEKIIYWLLGVGTGIVLSGMVMLGIALTLITPVDEVVTQNREQYQTELALDLANQTRIKTDAELKEPLKIGGSEEKQDQGEKEDKPKKEDDIKNIEIVIPDNYGSEEIATLLKNNGVIEDEEAFREYIKSKNKTKSLQHGKLNFPKNGRYSEILDILLTPNQ